MNRPDQVQINLNDTESVLCTSCDGAFFDHVFIMKRLSALISPTGKKTMVPIQLFKCHSCGHVNSEFLEPGRDPETSNEGP